MIKAVLFDLDGTLIDSFASNYEFNSELFKKAGYSFVDIEDYRSLSSSTMREVIQRVLGDVTEAEIRRISELGLNFSYTQKHPVTLQPYVAETLEILSKEYVLGIVSDANSKWIFDQPLSALKEYFKVAIGFEDVQSPKPDPEGLLLATQQLEVSPSECVYIGDAEIDIKTGIAAQIKTILYGKKVAYNADAATTSFREIPEILRGL